jgi:hypothetical protein
MVIVKQQRNELGIHLHGWCAPCCRGVVVGVGFIRLAADFAPLHLMSSAFTGAAL